MRTLVIIVAGILLWAITMGLARLLHIHASSSWAPLGIFAAVWLVITGWNVWIGVTQAGYTFWEELPIFLLTYLLPVAVAIIIRLR